MKDHTPLPAQRRIACRGIAAALTLTFTAGAVLVAGDVCAGDIARATRALDNSSDLTREAQISTVFAMSPLLRDSVLIVRVEGSNVSLVGKVGNDVEKDLAEQIALSVDGIKHVDNLIGVTDSVPSRIKGGDLSFRQKIDDATTTAAIRSKLLWGSTTSGLKIAVVTVDGRVRLDGTVYDAAQKDLINRIAADTDGVVSVTDGSVVFSVPPLTSGAQAATQAGSENRRHPVSDMWITARIRSTFSLSPSVGRSDIRVATSEGSVSLSGLVGSVDARASAINLARNTRGVLSVDSTRLMIN